MVARTELRSCICGSNMARGRTEGRGEAAAGGRDLRQGRPRAAGGVTPGPGGERTQHACSLYRGRAPGKTTTGNAHEVRLPDESVAVQVTIVVPRGKKLPEGGTQTTEGAGSRSSLAVTENDTNSPGLPSFGSSATTTGGHSSAGGVSPSRNRTQTAPLLKSPSFQAPT